MKYYAIKPDRIVTDWSVCESLVKGVKGAQYKSFKSEADARAWLNGDTENNLDVTVPCIPYANDMYRISGDIYVVDSSVDPLTVRTKAPTRVSVDGSYNTETSVYGSGIAFFDQAGNVLDTYRMHGDKSEYAKARNVAGEVVAFSHAIAESAKKGLTEITIIVDYEGLFRWTAPKSVIVRDKACWGNRLSSPIAELHDRALAYASSHGITRIDYIWVRGHKGYQCNELVDSLAKEACGVVS